MKAHSTQQVNRHIKHLNVMLIRGEGYCYFLDTYTLLQVGESVMTPYISNLSIEQWVQEAQFARNHK